MSDMRYINRKVLEALKPMGRIDGDMPAAGANESTTIEAWRRECELLREELEQLKKERGSNLLVSQRSWNELQDARIERDKLKSEREQSAAQTQASLRPLHMLRALRLRGTIAGRSVDVTLDLS
jgi:hypothetical protein